MAIHKPPRTPGLCPRSYSRPSHRCGARSLLSLSYRNRATLSGKAFGACIGGLLGFTSCDTHACRGERSTVSTFLPLCQSQSKTETSPFLKRNYRILFCRSSCPTWAGPVASRVEFAQLQTTSRQLSDTSTATSIRHRIALAAIHQTKTIQSKNRYLLLIASLTAFDCCYRRSAAPLLS
ncbi:hypothetical protein F4805DRAFT_241725 [Annulohypoxylon moriforme]|nr:hypothetical protein F4805DRAFT_241725 [Annulohypoxylon moriforme]